MNSPLLILGVLLILVMVWLLAPIKRRANTFDEKGEAINVYQDHVKYLNQQHTKGFIDSKTHTQLLAELDTKSARAITAINQRRFAYHRSWWPIAMIVAALGTASGLYYYHYQHSGVHDWQAFKKTFDTQISQGLFDSNATKNFINTHNRQQSVNYCFAMQQRLLQHHDSDPDALANLALCHWSVGHSALASQAIERGLSHHSTHQELNYLSVAIEYAEKSTLTEENIERLSLILQNNPAHTQSLQLLAINSLNQGNYQQAKFFFSALKNLAPDDPTLLKALTNLETELGKMISEQQTHNVGVEKSNNTTATPTLTDDNDSITLDLNIIIAPNVQPALTPATDAPQTLFVIIRSVDGQLLMATKHQLPDSADDVAITIRDQQTGAMQQQPLTGHKTVNVVARISNRGAPEAHSGDVTSAATTITLPQRGVSTVHINRIVP